MIEKHLFQALDYTILVLVLVASLGIGVYFACVGGKQSTTAEYFKGNMNMKIIPIVMSMVATFVSSNMLLGLPVEVYHYGFDYCYSLLGSFAGAPFAIYGILPVFYKLQITSVYEYIQHRFNNTVRIGSVLMNVFILVVLASFVIYASVLALSQVTGLSVWTSILTTTAIGTTYTTIGGIKAVVWTDVLQLLIFISALLATLIKGSINVGGLYYIINKNIEGERLRAPSFSPDPTVRFTVWGLFIYSAVRSLYSCSLSQMQLQRFMCCPTKKAAQNSVWLNLLCSVPIITTYCMVGLLLYAMYWNCDPLSSQQIDKPDQLFPLFVMHTMGSIPGMPGLFVAGVYCAALSTLSSILNSLAAITLQDLIKLRWKKLADKKATYISKCIAASYGLICLLMIAAIMNLGTIIQSMQYLIGGSMGATAGLFVLGLMNPWATSNGTILGIVCGLGVSWWISIGAQIYRPPPTSLLPVSTANCSDILGDWTQRLTLNITRNDISDVYRVSYLWITPIAFLVTVFVGSLSSLFIGSCNNLNMELVSPLIHSVMKKCCNEKYKELQAKHKPIPSLKETNNLSIIRMENVEQITTSTPN